MILAHPTDIQNPNENFCCSRSTLLFTLFFPDVRIQCSWDWLKLNQIASRIKKKNWKQKRKMFIESSSKLIEIFHYCPHMHICCSIKLTEIVTQCNVSQSLQIISIFAFHTYTKKSRQFGVIGLQKIIIILSAALTDVMKNYESCHEEISSGQRRWRREQQHVSSASKGLICFIDSAPHRFSSGLFPLFAVFFKFPRISMRWYNYEK